MLVSKIITLKSKIEEERLSKSMIKMKIRKAIIEPMRINLKGDIWISVISPV